MSEPIGPLPDLPDDVRSLLETASRGAPVPPPGAEAAVLSKIAATVGAPALAATAVPASLALAKPVVAAVLAAVVAGGGVFVASRPGRQPTSKPPVVVAPPVSPLVTPVVPLPVAGAQDALAATASPAAVPDPTTSERPSAEPGRPRTTDPTTTTNDRRRSPRDGRRESELLEGARDALARGDGDQALRSLRAHEEAYPRGQLVEERRALAVVALALRGEEARARAAAAAFERAYPASLFLEMVRAAVGGGLDNGRE